MKKFIRKNDRLFVLYVKPGCCRGMASVSIWERVHPSWLIFKDKYIDSRNFWVADYDYDIEEGVKTMLEHAITYEEVTDKLQNSWKNFQKPIDK